MQEKTGAGAPDIVVYLSAERMLSAPPFVRRLASDTGVERAVGGTFQSLAAAKEEVAAAWVADRPVASLFGQLEQRLALFDRDFEQLHLGYRFEFIHGRRYMEHRAFRFGAPIPRPSGAGRCCRPVGKPEPVYFTDDRIAGYPAEFGGNLFP